MPILEDFLNSDIVLMIHISLFKFKKKFCIILSTDVILYVN